MNHCERRGRPVLSSHCVPSVSPLMLPQNMTSCSKPCLCLSLSHTHTHTHTPDKLKPYVIISYEIILVIIIQVKYLHNLTWYKLQCPCDVTWQWSEILCYDLCSPVLVWGKPWLIHIRPFPPFHLLNKASFFFLIIFLNYILGQVYYYYHYYYYFYYCFYYLFCERKKRR